MSDSKTVTLEFTIDQLNVVLAGLAKLPIEAGLGVFNFIQQQAQAQLQQAPQGPLGDKVVG